MTDPARCAAFDGLRDAQTLLRCLAFAKQMGACLLGRCRLRIGAQGAGLGGAPRRPLGWVEVVVVCLGVELLGEGIWEVVAGTSPA